jgi:hypothetical protein
MFRDSAIQAWIAIAARRDMNCASQRAYFFGISYLSLGIDDLVWRQRQYAPDDGCWYKRSKPDLADLEEANHARVMDLDTGIADRPEGNRQGDAL